MTTLSPSLPQEEPHLQQSPNPKSTQHDQTHNQSQPQSPQNLTPEVSDPQNPEQPLLDQTPNHQKQEEEEYDYPAQSGMQSLNLPTNRSRGKKKAKKGVRKKQQAIEKKVQTLTQNLKPIPFVPSKTLNFDKHEKLLKRLSLWEFVHVEFDLTIRVDLLAQLIANYDSRSRSSLVNGLKVRVNRADLARAFKLPVKKEKGNVSSEAVDLDLEDLSEESIGFIEQFVSNWVLLHEDTWMMPNEVLNWTRAIKDGHPEKVDWAGLIWFMVEKELMQGKQLEDCYYASHLQYLMKSQREEMFREEPKVPEEVEVKEEEEEEDVGEGKIEQEPIVEAEVEVEEEGGGEVKMGEFDDFCVQESEDNVMVEEPNVELTLGKEIVVEEEEVKDVDMMAIEETEVEEQGQWLLDGKNISGDHFLQRCSIEADTCMDGDEERKPEEEEHEEDDEEEEEAEDDRFNLISKGSALEGDILTGNLLQGIETTHMPFDLPGPSDFGHGSKREIDHDHDVSLNGSNKRLRTDGSWTHKSPDFNMCFEEVHQWMEKARMMYQAKEHACEESNMTQQFLLGELQRRDHVIEHLQKTKREEIQKKDGEIYRLERELYVMGNLLEGYRKALKETHKAFSVYRQQCQVPEEPIYKDAGPGGIVLSTMELEKQRLKMEEEDRLNRIIIEQKIKEVEEEVVGNLEAHLIEVQKLDNRLMDLESEVKLMKELPAKPKDSETSESAPPE